MAKAKKNKQAAAKPKAKPRASTSAFSAVSAAERYAQLLADPCNADLVPSPIGDGGGSLVVRFERDFIIGNGATETAAALAWCPGEPAVVVPGTALTGEGVTFSWVTASPVANFTPGWPFIDVNASQVRCIAACAQVYWPGSELNRQGIISMSRAGADTLSTANNQVPTIRSTANYIQRTPEGVAEIVWRPNEYDTYYSEPGAEGFATAIGKKKTALVITGAGLPAAVGLRVRLVAVYEYIPRVESGFKLTSRGHAGGLTLGSVLNKLDSRGDWMYNAVHTGARIGQAMFGGVGSIASLANGAMRIGKMIASY
ncbi:putative capsid protein [Freshwater macrophyte associated tombus-like virus 1]|nr:putative capsid protein [Freshwater macrophyte associated tombus-like virus 1]